MTDREKLELQREAARKALTHAWPDARSSTVEYRLDRLFPLPEPETVTAEAWEHDYRVTGAGRVEFLCGGKWYECNSDEPDAFLQLAAMIQKARDREWVKAHPDGVPDPHQSEMEWLVEGGRPTRRVFGTVVTDLAWTPERIRLVYRLLNGCTP